MLGSGGGCPLFQEGYLGQAKILRSRLAHANAVSSRSLGP